MGVTSIYTLLTGLPFANPTVNLGAYRYPSASSGTEQGLEGNSIFPGISQGLCPSEPLAKGLPTTDAAAGSAAALMIWFQAHATVILEAILST